MSSASNRCTNKEEMMKTLFRLVTGFAVLLLLAAPVFATGADEEAGAPARTSTTDESPTGPYEPPISVSYHAFHQPAQDFLEGDSFEDNLWTRAYSDELGVELSFPWSAQSGDAYRQRLNIAIATGQLADIFSVSPIIFGQLVEDGRLAPLDDAWEYMSDDGRAIMEWSPVTRIAGTRDGVLYGIAEARGPEGKNLWVRQDWLDALGLDAPQSVAEFIEVARAFTFDDPDGNGQDDTIGFGISGELDDALQTFFSGWGGYPISNFWVESGGQLEYGAIQPGMREALRALRAMFEEGTVDPEFGVKGEGELYDDIAAGRVGMYAGYFWSPLWPLNALKGEDPESDWVPVYFPSPSGEPAPEPLDLTPGEFWVARADFPYPEVLVKMMNLFLEYQDEQPEYFNQIDANGEVLELFHLAPVQYNTWRNNVDAAAAIQRAIPVGEILPEHGVAPASMFGAEQAMLYATGADTTATPWAYHKVFADGGSMNLVRWRMDNDGYLENAFFGPPGDAWLRHGQAINDLVEEWYVKFVTGEESIDSDWDAYIDAFSNIGGAEVTAEVNAWFENQ